MLKNVESHFPTKKDQVLLVGAKGSSEKKNDSKKVNKKAKTKDNKNKTDTDSKGVCFHCNKPGHWKRNYEKYLVEANQKKLSEVSVTNTILFMI